MLYIKLAIFSALLFATMVSCDPAHAKSETRITETKQLSLIELIALRRAKNKIQKPITPTDKVIVIIVPSR